MKAPKDWNALRARARAIHGEVYRTCTEDGPQRYVLICGDWDQVFRCLDHLVEHIEDEEARQREAESLPSVNYRPMTTEERERHRQEACLGALSSAIAKLERMLSGKQAISRVTLTMAQSEGRDYLKELQQRRDARVVERFRLSSHLAATGKTPRRHAEYQRAAIGLIKVGDH